MSTENQEEADRQEPIQRDTNSAEPIQGDAGDQVYQAASHEVAGVPATEPPWPTNGGPLGCLLGSLSGLLLGAFLGTTLLIPYRAAGIILAMLLCIGLAIIGWKIGRSLFREYTPPKPRQRLRKR